MFVILFMCNNVSSYKLPKAMKCNVRCQVSMLQIVLSTSYVVILFTCLPITYTDTNIVQCFQVSYIAERKPYFLLLLSSVFVQSHWFVIVSDKYKVCLFFFICFVFASKSTAKYYASHHCNTIGREYKIIKLVPVMSAICQQQCAR